MLPCTMSSWLWRGEVANIIITSQLQNPITLHPSLHTQPTRASAAPAANNAIFHRIFSLSVQVPFTCSSGTRFETSQISRLGLLVDVRITQGLCSLVS